MKFVTPHTQDAHGQHFLSSVYSQFLKRIDPSTFAVHPVRHPQLEARGPPPTSLFPHTLGSRARFARQNPNPVKFCFLMTLLLRAPGGTRLEKEPPQPQVSLSILTTPLCPNYILMSLHVTLW